MADPFIGEIRAFAFTFAPAGWSICDGSVLPISQNTALFSLLNTNYGGNGTSTFALPDLRSRCAIHFGQSPGGSDFALGERGGELLISLTTGQMPSHTHNLDVIDAEPDSSSPVGRTLCATTGTTVGNAYGTSANGHMPSTSVSTVGGSAAHENRMPSLALLYCIALTGVYPTRS